MIGLHGLSSYCELLTPRAQVSGHVTTAEGVKVYAVGGKWNEYLDAQKCDEEGDPLPDAPIMHLWKV